MIPHPFHEFPKNLYASGPVTADGQTYPSAIHVYNSADEAKFRKLGYGDTYIPQAYPKVLHKTGASVTVADASEERTWKAKGWVTVDKIQGGAA